MFVSLEELGVDKVVNTDNIVSTSLEQRAGFPPQPALVMKGKKIIYAGKTIDELNDFILGINQRIKDYNSHE